MLADNYTAGALSTLWAAQVISRSTAVLFQVRLVQQDAEHSVAGLRQANLRNVLDGLSPLDVFMHLLQTLGSTSDPCQVV